MTHPIHAAARPYLSGWRYGRTPRVAWPWPKGVRGPAFAAVAADREIDCSTQTASVVMRAYPDAGWTQEDYRDLQVWDPARPDSPIDAVVRRLGAVQVEAFVAEGWHICQGWRDDKPADLDGDGLDGHAFIVYSRGNGLLDLLESTSKEHGKGPRWRITTDRALRDEFPASLLIAQLP